MNLSDTCTCARPGHVRSECTSSEPPQAGPQVECFHGPTSRLVSDRSESPQDFKSHGRPFSDGTLPDLSPTVLLSNIRFAVILSFSHLIYNPLLHSHVSSSSIVTLRALFAPLFCNPAFTFGSCTLSPTHGFLSWPGFTGPHAPMTRHGASLSGPACSHLPGHVPFTRLTPRAHAVTIHA